MKIVNGKVTNNDMLNDGTYDPMAVVSTSQLAVKSFNEVKRELIGLSVFASGKPDLVRDIKEMTRMAINGEKIAKKIISSARKDI